MEVQCKVCGCFKYIPKTHKDYKAIARNSHYPFICENCAVKIQVEMQKQTGLRKFLPYPPEEPGSPANKGPSEK